MEHFEKHERFENDEELSDRELDSILPEWKSPIAPQHLRAALFPEAPASSWRRLWSISIRVPFPVACCLAIVLALVVWRWGTPPPPRVVIQHDRVEVPVVKQEVVTRTVYRDRIVHAPPAASKSSASELQPVVELRPRIIRRQNDQN